MELKAGLIYGVRAPLQRNKQEILKQKLYPPAVRGRTWLSAATPCPSPLPTFLFVSLQTVYMVSIWTVGTPSGCFVSWFPWGEQLLLFPCTFSESLSVTISHRHRLPAPLLVQLCLPQVPCLGALRLAITHGLLISVLAVLGLQFFFPGFLLFR